MDIRADLSQHANLCPGEWQWVDSPQAGVSRVMLDRVGDEVAVATSFVRFAPDSSFPRHTHGLGEEFIVLEGEFGDEHGRYPPGTYVRNPAGTQHVPFSEPGCLIWVKLRQFDPDDQDQKVVQLGTDIPENGLIRRQIHVHGEERVAEIVAGVGEVVELSPAEVTQELLVLEGELSLDQQPLPVWSWLRVPAGSGMTVETNSPVRLFWKTRPATVN